MEESLSSFAVPVPAEHHNEGGDVYEMQTPYGIVFRHIFLAAGNTYLYDTRPYDEPYVLFFCSLESAGTFTIPGDTAHGFPANTFLSLVIPSYGSISLQASCKQDADLLMFCLSFSFLSNNLPPDHPWLAESGSSLTKALLTGQPQPLSSSFRSILFDILLCPLESRYKALFLKAKTLELLALEMQALKTRTSLATIPGLKPAEVQRMLRARDILLSNLRTPPGIIELAQQVGTNENYLKRHFKLVHGCTVFNFISKARMERAKHLISVEQRSLSEVAGMLGYKHAHHFSSAFRKIFGFSPVKLKALILGFLHGPEWACFMEYAGVCEEAAVSLGI